jgi:hypothetical protein
MRIAGANETGPITLTFFYLLVAQVHMESLMSFLEMWFRGAKEILT